MRMRVRLRTVVAVAALLLVFLLYTFVDVGSIRDTRSVPSRRLQIARITSEDIARLAGRVGPAGYSPLALAILRPPTPSTVVPATRNPHQIPFLSRHGAHKLKTAGDVGNLHYDATDVVSPLAAGRQQSRQSGDDGPSNSDNRLGASDRGELLAPDARLPAPDDGPHPLDVRLLDLSSTSQQQSSKLNTQSEDLVNKSHSSDVPSEDNNNNSIYTKEKELIALAPFQSIPIDKRKKLELYLSHLSEAQFNEVFKSVVGYDNVILEENLEKTMMGHHGGDKKSPSSLLSSNPSSHRSVTSNVAHSQDRPKPLCINGCRAHKHFASSAKGYAARVEVESITLPPDWTSSPDVERRLEDRQQHVREVCHKHGLDVPSANNSLNAWEFLINPKHKLVWCSVFKAASSTWFYNFNILAGYSENRLLKAKETPITLARKKYPRPSESELRATMNQTEPPLSFMIARHPLHRLVSGYRDKLLSGRRYYSHLAQKIVMSYPELGSSSLVETATVTANGPDSIINTILKRSKANRKIVVPTFPQFVQFLIDSNKRSEVLDEHWTPMYKFCSPCLFQFDVIAKMETLDEDANFVIFESGIQDIIRPKRINRNRNAPTDKVADSFLCQLSTPMMRDLVDLYKYDLELFEYDYSHYMNCTADHVRLQKIV